VPEKTPFCAVAPLWCPFGKIFVPFPADKPKGRVTCRTTGCAFLTAGARGKSVKREGVAVKKAWYPRCRGGSPGGQGVIFAHSPAAVPFLPKEAVPGVFFRRHQPFRPNWG